jgi:hypothetical protein
MTTTGRAERARGAPYNRAVAGGSRRNPTLARQLGCQTLGRLMNAPYTASGGSSPVETAVPPAALPTLCCLTMRLP